MTSSRNRCTLSSFRAISSRDSFEISGGVLIRVRTFPLTCTTISIVSRSSAFLSGSGQDASSISLPTLIKLSILHSKYEMKNKIKSGSYSNSLKLDYVTQFNEFFGIQTTKNRRAIEKLDLLLLAIEAVDINASVSLASISKSVDLNHIFPNFVEIWKSRCHNPMRKSTRNSPITTESFEALIRLLSNLSLRFYPKIRNLLSSRTSQLYN